MNDHKNKELDKFINEKIDIIIDNAVSGNNKNQTHLSESLVPKILTFLGFGMPRHRKFRAYLKNYEKCVKQCEKSYESEKTTYSGRNDAFQDLDDKTSDKDIKQTQKMDSEVVKNNPELGKCITRCRLILLRSLVDLIKEEGDKICDKNKMTDTCKQWIEDNLPELESELEYLENAVTMLKRAKDDKKIQNVLKKINQNLISKK